MRKLQLSALALSMALTPLSSVSAFEAAFVPPETQTLYRTHTTSEIRSYANSHPASISDSVTYTIDPSFNEPYEIGELSEATSQSALNLFNQIRYIAGLDEVHLDSQLSRSSQASAYLNAANGYPSHTPTLPEWMNAESAQWIMYLINAPRANHIAYLSPTLNAALVNMWIYDSDPANISNLGHRFSLLDFHTNNASVGFGAVQDEYVLDYVPSSTPSDYLSGFGVTAWPTTNTPIEYFREGSAWSIDVPNTTVSIFNEDCTLTVTRVSDGRTWTFSQNYSDGYFNMPYDSRHFVFKPDGLVVRSGDSFNISLTMAMYGNVYNYLNYTASFFDLYGDSSTDPLPTDPDFPFVDVPSDSYAYEPVKWAYQNGITTGVSPTRFDPNSTCTRAQIVTFLWRAADSPKVDTALPFTDVNPNDYYAEAVKWAVANEITTGTSPTTFSPNGICTRSEAVTFLERFAGGSSTSYNVPFNDVKPGDWFYNSVGWAVENGITSGYNATTFAPGDACTRAQIVTFLYRYFE